MIIYIHGFGSSGLGAKAKLFKNEFGDSIITPSLPVSPDLAIDTLKQLIQSYLKYEKVLLIGSSLGGFYGQYLSSKYDLKLVAINPVVKADLLFKHIGQNKLFYDQTIYEYTPDHFKQLQKYQAVAQSQNILLCLSKDDETLDYNDALTTYPHAQKIVQDSGGHDFLEIDRHFQKIKDFFFHSL